MERIILDFNGTTQDFQNAIDSIDDQFNFIDSLFWEMDYGEGESHHHTQYGDITIKYMEIQEEE